MDRRYTKLPRSDFAMLALTILVLGVAFLLKRQPMFDRSFPLSLALASGLGLLAGAFHLYARFIWDRSRNATLLPVLVSFATLSQFYNCASLHMVQWAIWLPVMGATHLLVILSGASTIRAKESPAIPVLAKK